MDDELTSAQIKFRVLIISLIVVLLLAVFFGNRAYQEISDLRDSVDSLQSDVEWHQNLLDALHSDDNSIRNDIESLRYDVDDLRNVLDEVCRVLNIFILDC